MTWQEFSAALQALARKMPTVSPNPLDERLVHVRYAMDHTLGQVKAAARYEALAVDVAARRAS
jgi:hypothetical protein